MQFFRLLLILPTVFLSTYCVLADDDSEEDVTRRPARPGHGCQLRSNNKPTDIAIPQPERRQRRHSNNSTSTNATAATDDECKFTSSLVAKSEIQQLALRVTQKRYPRDYCMSWKIVVSSPQVIEVQIPLPHSLGNVVCKDGYLKLFDDDCELTSDIKKWSKDSKIITKGSDLWVYFRPGYCTGDIALSYRAVPNLPMAEKRIEDSDDKDNNGDEDKEAKEVSSSSPGTIVGAVIGSVIAVVLLMLVLFLVFKWRQRSRARNSTSSEERATVHFWSKPSGYAPADEVEPTSSRDNQDPHGQQSAVSPKKSLLAGPCLAPYNTAALASPPAPPPYGPSTSGSFHHSEDLPPSYVDAVKPKH